MTDSQKTQRVLALFAGYVTHLTAAAAMATYMAHAFSGTAISEQEIAVLAS